MTKTGIKESEEHHFKSFQIITMSYPGLPQTQSNYSPNAVPYLEEGDELDEVLRTLDDLEQKH